MTAPNLPNFTNLINDGQPVAAGTVNLPLSQINQRVDYIWQVLNAASIGSAVFARQQTVASAVLVGTPVFFNSNTNQYEPALAGVQYNATTGELENADSADVWGIVFQKFGPTQADILLFGYACLNITAALEPGQVLAAGVYYLSRAVAGKLTTVEPALGAAVLRSDGQGNVYVLPAWSDLAGRHTHLHFALQPVPAGHHTPPTVGHPHVITDPNPEVEGWLPANHAIFNGKAPHDAKFGYNISVNSGLKAAWPPLPAQNAVILQDGVQVKSGPGEILVMDSNGIWWMSDCYATVPFPPTERTQYDPGYSESAESESLDACPFPYEMSLDLYFTKLEFMTDATVVTDLVSLDPRLQITCQNQPGISASVGPLALNLDLAFVTDTVDPGGYLGIKGYSASTSTFHFGPIAAGVYSLSSNVSLTGDITTNEVISSVSQTVYHGRVGINVAPDIDRELFADLVRLNGVGEEFFSNIMYLSMLPGVQSSMRVRIPVPETLSLSSPTMALQLRLVGFSSGTLPQLTVSYCRVPFAGDVPAILPDSDTSLTIVTTAVLAEANEYVDVVSDAFDIVAGDDVFLTIERLSTDGYAGELGVLRISAILVAT